MVKKGPTTTIQGCHRAGNTPCACCIIDGVASDEMAAGTLDPCLSVGGILDLPVMYALRLHTRAVDLLQAEHHAAFFACLTSTINSSVCGNIPASSLIDILSNVD